MKYNLNNLERLLQNQETINKISIMLKTTPFNFKDYCGGIQVNWRISDISYMWRSNEYSCCLEKYDLVKKLPAIRISFQ